MKAGDVFFGGDYATLLADGREDLPAAAKSGIYALGKMIMVSRRLFREGYGLPDLPEWFPARVCLPPPVPGQWYRWYDPFIWFETEGPIHSESDSCPSNMSYVGKLWHPPYVSKFDGETHYTTDFWARPIEEYRLVVSAEETE